MGQGSIIGYEINEKTCQISFYNEKDLEPDTLEVDTDNYQIPLIIGKLRDTWAYGKEAKRLVTIKDGFTATRLLSKSLAGDKIEFGEETYDAVWLLSQFIQMSLQSFPEIDGIVFTVPSLSEEMAQMLRGIAVRMNIDKRNIFNVLHVRGDDLRVIRDDRAVIVVVPQPLVQIIGKAGIENRLYAVVDKRLHMPMHQLSGITHRIGRDSLLSARVKLFVGNRRIYDLKAKRREKAVPERKQLVHVKPHRDADFAARAGLRLIRLQKLQLVIVDIERFIRRFFRNRAFAAVTADKSPAVREFIDCQAAVVAAKPTVNDLYFMCKGLERFPVEQRALPALTSGFRV